MPQRKLFSGDTLNSVVKKEIAGLISEEEVITARVLSSDFLSSIWQEQSFFSFTFICKDSDEFPQQQQVCFCVSAFLQD
jgi:hypothetical protein